MPKQTTKTRNSTATTYTRPLSRPKKSKSSPNPSLQNEALTQRSKNVVQQLTLENEIASSTILQLRGVGQLQASPLLQEDINLVPEQTTNVPCTSTAAADNEKTLDDRKYSQRPTARRYSDPWNCCCPYQRQTSGYTSPTFFMDSGSSYDLTNNKKGNPFKFHSSKRLSIRRVALPQNPLFCNTRLSTRMQRLFGGQDEPISYSKQTNMKKQEPVSMSKIQFFYYKASNFQHFDYVYKLTRDCKLRNFREIHCYSIDTSPMPKDVILKIGIVGDFTEENLRFITKSKGKRKLPKDQNVWKVTPLLCFLNDLDKESAIELLRGKGASENIRIKPATNCNATDEITNSLIFVHKNKEDNIRAITSCLEKPIHQMLQNWSTYLETKGLGKHTSRVIAEIKAIGKQLVLEESKGTAVVSEMKCKSIVPSDMKDYLFGSPDVNAFGIWGNLSFKIFVKKTTDQIELRNELIKRYRHFFDIYPLDVEVGKFIEHHTLKQGDPIFANNACEELPTGTLGGFVLKVNEERKKYALTCNHIFPSRNQIAYADDSDDGGRRQIGSCIFTRSDMSTDFAAIEMNDTILNECDVIFRREDGKDINAHIYDDILKDVGIVHKIGATTGVTKGYILSSEFYNKYTAEGNRECIFLVKGTDGIFSEEGDSGSLVFSRPRGVQQNYVHIVGMVYAKNRRAKDDVEVEIYNRTDKESVIVHSNQNISTEVKNAHENIQQTPSLSRENDGQRVAENDQNAEDFSFCYRLNTALKLFKQEQGPGFDVRFKDDLSSSSSATSLSSGSDVEAV